MSAIEMAADRTKLEGNHYTYVGRGSEHEDPLYGHNHPNR